MISLWNQLVKNEIHLENKDRAKLLCFKIKSTKQEFNFTASYQNLPMVRKKKQKQFFDLALSSWKMLLLVLKLKPFQYCIYFYLFWQVAV